jgi:PIN domain nuclease of toxin-antitoxin system
VNGLLLDTCALIWSADNSRPVLALRSILEQAWHEDQIIAVSPMSAWEIGTLAAKGRMALGMSPLVWFETVVLRGRLRVDTLTAGVLVASTTLPDLDHRDPIDRIIIATARELGYRIVTRDRAILDYAEKGHVMALAC